MVGNNIKKRRLELRMSQQDLAEAMGYKTRSTIAKIESGENDVSQKKLQKFAAVLNTKIEALIGSESSLWTTTQVIPEWDNKKQKNVAVVLAGGKSGSNRQNIPNQFVHIQNKPLIVYSMDAYQMHPAIDDIYVVCLKGWEAILKAYAEQYGITKLRGIIPAGASGITSLKNAVDYLKKIYSPEDFVIIQEATRPLVTLETLSLLLQNCQEKGSATICHSMNEYVQFSLSEKKADYIDRNNVIALQSPEAHKISFLKEVFDAARKCQHRLTENSLTMLLCNLGYTINFVESRVNNIKIAREEDIATLDALIKKEQGYY